MPEGGEELLKRLESDYESTKIISVVEREGEMPRVEWTGDLSENDVVATLFKALLYLTVDSFLYDMVETMFEEDDDEGDS